MFYICSSFSFYVYMFFAVDPVLCVMSALSVPALMANKDIYITPPFLNGFAPNFMQTPRIRSLDSYYPQNSYPTLGVVGVAGELYPRVRKKLGERSFPRNICS